MYKFTKDCMTGIESIDKEHEQLFKIINEAQALLEEQAVDVKTVKSIVAHLVDYAAEHFAHESFVDRLTGINMEEVDDGQQEYLFELIDYLLEWLKNHILKMDKQIPAK